MSDERNLEKARDVARKLGLRHETLVVSNRKGKRFAIEGPEGHKIHFGQWPVKGTYLDIPNPVKREAWHKRHREIKDSKGATAVDNPMSSAYYSARILW